MRILVAPDAFKGTLSASDAAAAIAAGLADAIPAAAIETLPLADGGEGTVEVLVAAAGGEVVFEQSTGPFDEPVRARVGVLPDGTRVLESALFCSAADGRLDADRASSYGLGWALGGVLAGKPPRILVGLGGTSTVDGGVGLVRGLGGEATGRDRRPVPAGGAGLLGVVGADLMTPLALLSQSEVVALCDVAVPLLGAGGARAFMAQKGVEAGDALMLEAGLGRWAEAVETTIGMPERDRPGAGAAGGIGFALAALGATLESGAEVVLDLVGIDARLADVDLVVTGEGRLDEQTATGKLIAAVARRCAKASVPLWVVCGQCEDAASAAETLGLAGVTCCAAGPEGAAERLRAAAAQAAVNALAQGALLQAGRANP